MDRLFLSRHKQGFILIEFCRMSLMLILIPFQVNFTDFHMESHPDCGFDYVEIFNGPYASSPSIGRFCGTSPPTNFRSQSNALRIVLFTDFSMSEHGFRMTYEFNTQGKIFTLSFVFFYIVYL